MFNSVLTLLKLHYYMDILWLGKGMKKYMETF